MARLAAVVMAVPAGCCLFLAIVAISPSSPEGVRSSPEVASSALASGHAGRGPSVPSADPGETDLAPEGRALRPLRALQTRKSDRSRTIEPASYLRSLPESTRPTSLLDLEVGCPGPQRFPEATGVDNHAPRPIHPFAESGDRGRLAAGSIERLVAESASNPLRHMGEEFLAEVLPEADPTVRIPLSTSVPPDAIQVNPQNGLVTIAIREAPLDEILGILAEREGLNLICAEDVTANVSITVRDVPFDEALSHILSVAGYTCRRQGNFLLITSVASGDAVSPQAQGREIRVFSLSYVSAADVDLVVQGLLSPVGQSFVGESDPQDHRKTREVLIVEDLPAYLSRIEETIRQLDTSPRQVLIEAHILSVDLEDDLRHGINWAYLKESNPKITLKTTGFANAAAPQAMIFDFAASEMTGVVEWLKTTTDAKTLASPKVFALNGQEAKIQIGEQLGYHVTTTTQTSTLESVEFLDVGVILTVTPQITPDNHVLMKVKPVISTGQISPDTKLPEEETTEVETSVMLRDGHGIVIGGLIQEEDMETQQKIPWLGDMWLVGWLFQKRTVDRKRSEIVIALIPHVVPYGPEISERETHQFHRATTPLVQGALQPYPRPYEPTLPTADDRPSWLCGRRRCLPATSEVTYGSSVAESTYSFDVPTPSPIFYEAMPFEEVQPESVTTETIVQPVP